MADTIRVLVATDNHVGYNERDPIRGDDSWRSFHEIMCLAKDRDVDMVLLAGDLFHDNVPSRKSMYNVMRSLRLNCYGDKPCELEMLSDGSEHFDTTFGHANYEDPDINVAIPVFSIHGNHDDPSGEGHFAALDILEMSGLINYFGRTPESDNIQVRPVLLQKGQTKLALYGLSNVRDERIYRTFRDEKVKFFRPTVQRDDWFNVACVHQNHHAHTPTSYLPENFLPDFLDLVVWGHEHECDIEPHLNPEMGFRVMQPGSSVATSMVPGEAIPKQVAILNITGREFTTELVRLKTVRPFVYKDMVLNLEKEAVKMAQKDNHRTVLTQFLQKTVEKLIQQAKKEWQEAQEEDSSAPDAEPVDFPLPLIRLRVERTHPDGSQHFDVENPQRFSNRFIGRVANHNDVIQFHTKKRYAASRRNNADSKLDDTVMEKLAEFETVKVSKLVQEFLAAQSLTILPQNFFGDAVNQYIDKDDKHAMDIFVDRSLADQIKSLVQMHEAEGDEEDEEDLAQQIEHVRKQMEDMFAKGQLKNKGGKARFKPKPDEWDSDLDGPWEDQPGALIRPDDDDDHQDDDDRVNETSASIAKTGSTRGGRGRGRGGRGGSTGGTARGRGAARSTAASTAASRTKATATAAAAAASASGRSRRKVVEEESPSEDGDVVMLDDDDEEDDGRGGDANDSDSQAMFFHDSPLTSTSVPGRGARGGARRANASTTNRRNGSRQASATPVPAPAPAPASTTTATRKAAASAKKAPARSSTNTTATVAAAAKSRQGKLHFSTSQASVLGNGSSNPHSFGGKRGGGGGGGTAVSDIDDDDDDDDDDAFEPVTAATTRSRRR